MDQLRKHGISAKAVNQFLCRIRELKADLHSFCIYHGGKTVFSLYAYPFQADSMHRMYSSGKMLVALAVLKAVDENRLKLSDPVLPFFRGELPENLDIKYEALTVEHMLTMNTGHDYDTMMPMRQSFDWVKGFFGQPLTVMPGTKFFYNGGVPYILTKIVQKVTGMDYLDYLQEKFFEYMDVKIAADITTQGDSDPSGISIRIGDFEKLPVLLLNQGSWGGRQLIRAEIINQMGKYHCSSIQSENIPNVNRDTKFGYGYFLWRNSVGGYRLDGGRGQYGLVLPDLDLCVSIMASEEDQGLIPELFWNTVYPYIWSEEAPEWTEAEVMTDYRALPGWNQIYHDCSEVDGCTYRFEKNELGLEQVEFTIKDGVISAEFVQHCKNIKIHAGADGKERINRTMIELPEPDWFMNHVTGNADHNYYVAGRYILAPDFMKNKEITLFIRGMDKTVYELLSFRIANRAIRLEVSHGSWNCVKMRGRLELLPHIPQPVMILGRKAE